MASFPFDRSRADRERGHELAAAKRSVDHVGVSSEVHDWLIAGDPAIRWQAERDLLDADVVDGGDSGQPVARFTPDGAAGAALRATAQRVINLVPPVEDETCTARIARLVDALEAQPA